MNNRIIKFRYWSYEYKRFVIPRIWCRIDRTIDAELSHSSIVQQQFTGLKDKNDKEIYEGDIIECPADGFYSQPIIGKIIHKISCYYFISKKNYCNCRIEWLVEGDSYSKSIIIGNIFENPELLN